MTLLLLFNPQTAPNKRRAWASAPPNRIVLYGDGWTNPQPVNVSRLDVRWDVEQPGRLSCFVPAKELHRLGYDSVIGLIPFYQHPTQGPWVGIIEDEPGEIDSGLVEISAVDGRGKLMGRRSQVLYRQDTAHAGALMRHALSDVMTTDPILFDEVLCEEVGPPLEVEWRGDDLYDVAASLANQSGQEFDVVVDDARRVTFLWQEELGNDKTGTVLIREGAEITGGRIDRSLTTISNDIAGVANDESYERSSYAQAEDADSIAAYGRRQSPVRRYEGVVTESTVSAKVKSDVRREKDGTYLLSVTLPALHPVCHEIRHGDYIRVWSVVKNRELTARVMSRTVRDGVILELACEAVAERIPPRARSFTPDMLSGLVAWFDADDASTVVHLEHGVNEWQDKSGNNRHAAQSGSTRPDYVSHHPSFAGRSVLLFNNSDSYLRTASFDLSGTSAVTVVVVALIAGGLVGERAVCAFGDIASDAGSWQVDRTSADAARAILRGNVGQSSFETTTTWEPMAGSDVRVVFSVLNMALATNEASAWIDGSGAGGRANNSNNTGAFHSAKPLTIGASGASTPTSFWGKYIAEIFVFDRDMTAFRSVIESYVTQKWGL